MRTPYIAVNFNGRNLVEQWGPILIAVTVSDGRGSESDTVTIELDDLDGETEFPEPGEKITVDGGYLEDGVAVQGEYEIDTIDLEGWPQKITLNGTSASAKKDNKERKNEGHKKADTPTLGKLSEKIAKRNGWESKVSGELASIPIQYEGQSAESDIAFLTRVVGRYGGLAAVKQNKLVVNPKGAGKSVSGASIGGLIIAPGINLKTYKGSIKKKPEHGKAEASVCSTAIRSSASTSRRARVKSPIDSASRSRTRPRLRKPRNPSLPTWPGALRPHRSRSRASRPRQRRSQSRCRVCVRASTEHGTP
jgi:phage protein D